MKPNRIAITGAISSGKSEVGKMIHEMGYNVVNSDLIAREVVEIGSEGYQKVQKAFPHCFHGNILDRKKLAKEIFSDEKKRQLLNSILHPLIRKRSLELLNHDGLNFYEAPLLFETDFVDAFRSIVYVDAAFDLKCQRLMKREQIDEEYARLKLSKFQKPNYPFFAVIWNNGTIDELKIAVNQLLNLLEKNN